jgi:carboxypeptidase Q
LVNVHQEKWGPFGRGWTNTHFEAHLLEPSYAPLIGFPLAWTAGTEGTVSGQPMMAVMKTDADFEKFKGKLKGMIVMTDTPKELAFPTTVQGHRLTDAELSAEAIAQEPGARGFGPRPPGQPVLSPEEARKEREERRKFREKTGKFLKDEGVLLAISYGQSGEAGTVFASQGGPYEADKPLAIPMVALTAEHYNRIARLLDHKIPVKVAFNIQNQLADQPQTVNVVGEIPGNGKKDEIVMLGAHLDSWHGATGATDNAAGSSVMIETMRILKTLNVKMDRTVRIALWSGEEEGLLGSKAYVKEHFADLETMKLTAEHSKLAGYYNYDNGTGKIRGIYLQGNDMVRPIFEAWLAPFKDLGATTVSIRNTGGTDHLSFDAIGLPGFQFIQDPMDYSTRTHHSNMDTYDRIQAGDLMQASAIIATFVYETATRPEMLPRKSLPKAQPKKPEEGEKRSTSE